jgi:hypothetical protein
MTDFSGEWILNRPASTLSPGADAMTSGGCYIDHRDPVFHMKAAFAAEGEPIEWEFTLDIDDGADAAQGADSPGLRWDGDALVATFRVPRPDGEMTIVFRYELVDEGKRLRAVERLRGSDHDQDNVWIFDRR